MTHEQKKSRQKKASLLEVRQQDPITFLVQSQSDPEMYHKVILNGHSACSCLDWRKNHETDPAWACKHIAAALDLKAQVERVEAQEAPQVNGSGLSQKERVELECAAMFGDMEAAAILNGKPVKAPRMKPVPSIEIPRTTAEEASGSEPLDPCMGCGCLFPASEMLPHQSAEGSGLICQECHQDLQDRPQEEAQPFPLSGIPEAPRVPTLAERIDQVNEILSSFGAEAIEADQKGFTGYGAQYVLDAVNTALGPDGWKYDLVNHSLEKIGDKGTRALVMIQLSLKQDDGSWFCHGPQFGGGQSSDPADALKSALTDALKKALSHWGIGSKAYRGELKASKAGKAA